MPSVPRHAPPLPGARPRLPTLARQASGARKLKEIAAVAGTTPQTLHRWRNSDVAPQSDHLQRVLDLAYVAAGRVDAFWEIGLSPWDTAAGTLLIQEAGGRIGTLTGEEYRQEGHVIAGTPKVYSALVSAFAPYVPQELRTT